MSAKIYHSYDVDVHESLQALLINSDVALQVNSVVPLYVTFNVVIVYFYMFS